MPVRPARRPQARGRPLRYLVALALLVALLVTGPLALRWWTNHRFGPLIYSVATAPRRRVAIVFGAGLWPDGSPSPILADRVSTAVALYERGAVDKLLMTGDNRHLNYNEPGAMRAYAGALGVPEDDIVLDYAGRRTYDSCSRARHIFGVTDAVLVTQATPRPRLFTAHHLGIDVVGVAADQRGLSPRSATTGGELAATTVAYWQVLVTRPGARHGEPLPIFDEGVSEQGPQRRPAPS